MMHTVSDTIPPFDFERAVVKLEETPDASSWDDGYGFLSFGDEATMPLLRAESFPSSNASSIGRAASSMSIAATVGSVDDSDRNNNVGPLALQHRTSSYVFLAGNGLLYHPLSSHSSTSVPMKQLQLPLDIPEEGLLCVASFLPLGDVRELAAACHLARTALFSSRGANSSIWMKALRERFPSVIDAISCCVDEVVCAMTDANPIHPICGHDSRRRSADANLALLTGLLPARHPRAIDSSTLPVESFHSLTMGIGDDGFGLSCSEEGDDVEATEPVDAGKDQRSKLQSSVMVPVVKFVGTTGVGDRSIRSDHPFPPNPCKLSSSGGGGRRLEQGPKAGLTSWMKRYQHEMSGKNAVKLGKTVSKHIVPLSRLLTGLMHVCHSLRPCGALKPFAVPIADHDARNGKVRSPRSGLVVDLTPSLLAYFEVTIGKRGSGDQRKNTAFGPRRECVAIGLSSALFDPRGSMPGWDKHSYGYHGDDGGLFHDGPVFHGDRDEGTQRHRRLPRYGPGDVVGCGLDYASRRIFFVKNGDFLGYYFEAVGRDVVEDGLYPTVGVDAGCPLFVNFGERPFMFDLRGNFSVSSGGTVEGDLCRLRRSPARMA